MTGEIKAIETVYKGYRFRSRLEARWAVFFENAGIKWEYEKEGFDLGTLGWYLPDFYLPLNKMWIEIKPQSYSCERKRIYMAGKITQNGWRSNIVSAIRDYPPPSKGEFINVDGYPLDYVGPFFLSCDHGCSHGEKTHGVAPSCCISEREAATALNLDESKFHGGKNTYSNSVINKCFAGINKADTVFVWIDCVDCYATLIEAGYSYANKKDLRVGISESIKPRISYQEKTEGRLGTHELWFVQNMANGFVFSDTAKKAFDFLYKDVLPEPERKLKTLADSKKESYSLVYGDPVEFKCGGGQISPSLFEIDRDTFNAAATKARSARFEFGEQG